jgi:uncharacterized protein YndB with AHSA1/START domain
MSIDIIGHLGATTREVRRGERDGRPTAIVVARRTYDTSVEDLWHAITDVERIPRWFLPVTGDLRVGGRYQLEGNAGGEITECEPPERLAMTWEFGGDVTWVVVRLSEAGNGRATLELEHSAHPGEHWEQFGPGAVGIGWELALLGLALHLSTGEATDRAEWAAWEASEEAKAVMRQSSDGWCDADIASGTPEDVARPAAERTIAAYTATPEA